MNILDWGDSRSGRCHTIWRFAVSGLLCRVCDAALPQLTVEEDSMSPQPELGKRTMELRSAASMEIMTRALWDQGHSGRWVRHLTADLKLVCKVSWFVWFFMVVLVHLLDDGVDWPISAEGHQRGADKKNRFEDVSQCLIGWWIDPAPTDNQFIKQNMFGQ